MKALPRILALIFIFIVATVAWIALGGVMQGRSTGQRAGLYGDVAELWGEPLTQRAPSLTFQWTTVEEKRETHTDYQGNVAVRTYEVERNHDKQVYPASTDMDVVIGLDQRRKGLLWFSL